MTYRNVRWNIRTAPVFFLRGAAFPGTVPLILYWVVDMSVWSAAGMLWMGAWSVLIGLRVVLGRVRFEEDRMIVRNPYRTVTVPASEIALVGWSALHQVGDPVTSVGIEHEGRRHRLKIVPVPAYDLEILVEWLERLRPGWGGETGFGS